MATVSEKDTLIQGLQQQLEKQLRHRFGQRADRINLDRPGLFSKEELLAAMSKVLEPEQAEPNELHLLLMLVLMMAFIAGANACL